MWNYRDSKDTGGAYADQEVIFAWNRTGAAVARGYVGVVNDLQATLTMNGTSTAATTDGGDADFRKNITVMSTTNHVCRHVIAWKAIPKDGWGPWLIKGEVDESLVLVASNSGTAVNSVLTGVSSDTDASAVATAGVLTSRSLTTGTGNMDAMTVALRDLGRTLATTTTTAAATKIRFQGDGPYWNGG